MDVPDGESSYQYSRTLLLTTSCLGVIYYLFRLKNQYYYWDKLGIKGAHLLPIIGGFSFIFNENQKKAAIDRVKKFGKVHGSHFFGLPSIVVADPEVVRQICIKDHDVFPDHFGSILANKYQKLFLVWLKGDYWKKVRAIMSPTFTSGKIKRMFRFLDGCANDLLVYLDESRQVQKVDVHQEFMVDLGTVFKMYSMDGISTCCYGLKLRRDSGQRQDSTDEATNTSTTRDEFIRMASKVFESSYSRLAVGLMLPLPLLKMLGFELRPSHDYEPLVVRLRQLMRRRIDNKSSNKHEDLLQLLLDAKLDDELELDELDQAENHHAALTKDELVEHQRVMVQAVSQSNKLSNHETSLSNTNAPASSVKLSEIEVLSESIFLLAAGLETTSILLTHCAYMLAHNQEIQQRLYNELEKIVELDLSKKTHIFKYDSLTSCEYLDAVISETLRFNSPAPAVDRVASRDYYIEKYNVTIPKGHSVMISINAIHNDEEYWQNPVKFDPDRFLPENRDKIIPGSYIPFSLGPRHCIGMRFSLTEAKLGLAKVMMKYRFLPIPGSPYPPKLSRKPGLLKIADPKVLFVARNAQIM